MVGIWLTYGCGTIVAMVAFTSRFSNSSRQCSSQSSTKSGVVIETPAIPPPRLCALLEIGDPARGLKASGQHPDLRAAFSAPGKHPMWIQHGQFAGARMRELTAPPVRLACAHFPEARPAWR